jgi:hypothetical protein
VIAFLALGEFQNIRKIKSLNYLCNAIICIALHQQVCYAFHRNGPASSAAFLTGTDGIFGMSEGLE